MNRLAHETSPYLLQHAHNPVDWYPWGEEALQKARTENKPIVVSIGYSACHWCHVMERESFENQAVADVMNQHFVCIKVDREERPDVDAIYMDAVQAMGVRGGWPLNVFLMPDGKPFYGGTYFPPETRGQNAGWRNMLLGVANAFETQRDELQKSADGFALDLSFSETQKYGLQSIDVHFEAADLDAMYTKVAASFDTQKGGQNRAPKFPMPSIYKFLVRYVFSKNANAENKIAAQKQLELTLNRVALGGIYDHLGGGWARYSVDEDWFVPHFEKMLYDNAQLLSMYAEGFAVTKNELYRHRVYQTIDWIERQMTHHEGGFYSALDADSEGIEGKFYVWTYAELKTILQDDFDWFAAFYNITPEGNWEDGLNVLHRTDQHNWPDPELLRKTLATLYQRREEKIKPNLDDKILTSWNGLMLKGLVDAYRIFGEEKFLNLAIKNAQFLYQKMYLHQNGAEAGLWHSYKDGRATITGFLEDYAAVIDGYAALYQVTFDEIWLRRAEALLDYTVQNFWDAYDDLFYFTDVHAEVLIARKKELFDNVVPASNSVMAHNLWTLGTLLDRQDFIDMADRMLGKVKKLLLQNADYLTNWAAVFALRAESVAQIAIVGHQAPAFRAQIDQDFSPFRVFLGSETGSNIPLLADKTTRIGETTVYVCFDKTCQRPVMSVAEAQALLT